jgi:hypothetical protein
VEQITLSHDSLSKSPVIGGSGGFEGHRRVWAYDFEGKAAVVKQDRFSDNAEEVRIWERVKDTPIARLFAEVYAHTEDNEYIVMERVSEVLNKAADIDFGAYSYAGTGWRDDTYKVAYDTTVARLRLECGKYGMTPNDLHEGNFGIREDGSVCVIDYANFTIYGKGY